MTVAELQIILNDYPAAAEVVYEYDREDDYGNHYSGKLPITEECFSFIKNTNEVSIMVEDG